MAVCFWYVVIILWWNSLALHQLWGELQTSVATGSNCWGEAFGLDSSDVFASMYKEDSTILRFLHGMHSFSKLSAQAVLSKFDLSAFRTLVDLGGATGALATAGCGLYPQMRVVVVDLPHVISKATQHFATSPEAQRVQDRISWVAGDFFSSEQQLPAGDLYVLSRVLHDWEDARCAKLLRTVYQSLPVGECIHCLSQTTACMASDRCLHAFTAVRLNRTVRLFSLGCASCCRIRPLATQQLTTVN
jgi:acetylserotonin N-methyltransferase